MLALWKTALIFFRYLASNGIGGSYSNSFSGLMRATYSVLYHDYAQSISNFKISAQLFVFACLQWAQQILRRSTHEHLRTILTTLPRCFFLSIGYPGCQVHKWSLLCGFPSKGVALLRPRLLSDTLAVLFQDFPEGCTCGLSTDETPVVPWVPVDTGVLLAFASMLLWRCYFTNSHLPSFQGSFQLRVWLPESLTYCGDHIHDEILNLTDIVTVVIDFWNRKANCCSRLNLWW